MKSLLVIISLFWAANAFTSGYDESRYGASYECTGVQGQPIIKVSTKQGHAKFEYIVDNQTRFHLNLPDDALKYSNYWDTDRTYVNFNPPWGESTVHIYGRISEKEGSLFDVYANGMVTSGRLFNDTLTNYTCTLSDPLPQKVFRERSFCQNKMVFSKKRIF